MGAKRSELSPREQQIAELLLQGCSNTEIARQLRMNPRTVKAYFNRLFQRFEIKGGIKRVKLATLLYRRALHSQGLPSGLKLPAHPRYQALTPLPEVHRHRSNPTTAPQA